MLEEEVETRQLSKNGKVAVEIAAVFHRKLAAAYKRLDTIKEKINVDRIEQAVKKNFLPLYCCFFSFLDNDWKTLSGRSIPL